MKLSNFDFKFSSHGHYKVTYTSPKGKKVVSRVVSDMTLIDATRNADNTPTLAALAQLRRALTN
jgi:hypothetical protein